MRGRGGGGLRVESEGGGGEGRAYQEGKRREGGATLAGEAWHSHVSILHADDGAGEALQLSSAEVLNVAVAHIQQIWWPDHRKQTGFHIEGGCPEIPPPPPPPTKFPPRILETMMS